MNSKSKRCSRSCHEMLLTYSVGMESSASRQAVTAQQKESVWFPIQEDSLRLFIEFFQKASVFHLGSIQQNRQQHSQPQHKKPQRWCRRTHRAGTAGFAGGNARVEQEPLSVAALQHQEHNR